MNTRERINEAGAHLPEEDVQTEAERRSGVFPSNPEFPAGDPRRYGAVFPVEGPKYLDMTEAVEPPPMPKSLPTARSAWDRLGFALVLLLASVCAVAFFLGIAQEFRIFGELLRSIFR